ncbi:MAG TPA: Gfo/Idh/MocA family oxidoreductase [Thermomicrobiales bacterium]|nr:Gfo/Idh/MocA family oxidoreductase [Thermomicrobiales bacterium]
MESGDDRLRIGIVGMGAWGSRAHLPAFASLPGVEVVAVADPDEAATRRAADAFGIQRIETDADRLLRDPGSLDAVVIATPDDTHRDLVVAAFNAGLHILCEKPLARTVGDAEEMVAAAERAGRIAKIGFLFRHSPVVIRMHELVTQGLIGEVQAFEHVGVNAQFADPGRPLHWKMQRKHANGGVFVEYGAHTIDLAHWFGGPLRRVVAHAVTLIPERPLAGSGTGTVDGDDLASWIGEYASGGQALFRSGWASLPVGTGGMRVYGSRGTLLWEQRGRASEALLIATHDDPEPQTVLEYVPPYDPVADDGPFPLGIYARYNRRLAESFVSDIRAGQATAPTFADGLAAQRVLAAIRASLDGARWVDVDGD